MSTVLFTLHDDSKLADIACVLQEDGYPYSSEFARRVKSAYSEGRLVWTADHLVITGEDAGEYRPQR